MLKLIGDYMCNEIIKRENKNSNQNKNWSVKEDMILLNNYKQLGYSEVAKLVSRSSSSYISKARKLKIKRSYRCSKDEDDIIKKYYPLYGINKVSKLLKRNK